MYREKNWRETSVAETPLRSPNRVQILGGKACSRATGSEPCVVVALTGQDPECAPKWAARSVGSESEAELLSPENANIPMVSSNLGRLRVTGVNGDETQAPLKARCAGPGGVGELGVRIRRDTQGTREILLLSSGRNRNRSDTGKQRPALARCLPGRARQRSKKRTRPTRNLTTSSKGKETGTQERES
jgi:hypothetical protein